MVKNTVGHLAARDIWPRDIWLRNVWPKVTFDHGTFDCNWHLTAGLFIATNIWPRSNISCSQMYRGQMSVAVKCPVVKCHLRSNVLRSNVTCGKCPVVKCHLRSNVPRSNVTCGQMSRGQMSLVVKCPTVKCHCGQMSLAVKCHCGQMSRGQMSLAVKCPEVKCHLRSNVPRSNVTVVQCHKILKWSKVRGQMSCGQMRLWS